MIKTGLMMKMSSVKIMYRRKALFIPKYLSRRLIHHIAAFLVCHILSRVARNTAIQQRQEAHLTDIFHQLRTIMYHN